MCQFANLAGKNLPLIPRVLSFSNSGIGKFRLSEFNCAEIKIIIKFCYPLGFNLIDVYDLVQGNMNT